MPNDTKSAEAKSEGKQRETKEPTQPFSVRLTDGERERLERAAELFRRQTGSKETATGLAHMFIQIGLTQFESVGGLVVSG